VHSWTSITSHGWPLLRRKSSVHSMMPSTSSRSTEPYFRRPVSVLMTQLHFPYPTNMPCCTTGIISKILVPRVACARLPLNQNTRLPSSDLGADPTNAKLSNRSSSQTRGTINLQVLTSTSSNVECLMVPLPQMHSAGYFHLRVTSPYLQFPNPLHQCHNPAVPKTTKKIFLGQTTSILSEVILAKGRGA